MNTKQRQELWASMETGIQTSADEQCQVFPGTGMCSWGGVRGWIRCPVVPHIESSGALRPQFKCTDLPDRLHNRGAAEVFNPRDTVHPLPKRYE